MRATLEFNLPDDEYSHKTAIFGKDMFSAILWMGEHFRRTAMHDELNCEHATWALVVFEEAVRDLPFEDI